MSRGAVILVQLWPFCGVYEFRSGTSMQKWFLPLTVLGLGGLGLLVLSDRGQDALQWVFDKLDEAPDQFNDWNARAQDELDRIQAALNRVAESLEVAQ